MRKLLLLLMLASATAQAQWTVTFGPNTNYLGQIDTNSFRVTPILQDNKTGAPILANGTFITGGPSTWVTPNPTTGISTLVLMQGDYQQTNSALGKGVIFAVPTGSGSANVGDLVISGYNIFNYTATSSGGLNAQSITAGSTNVSVAFASGKFTIDTPYTATTNYANTVAVNGTNFANGIGANGTNYANQIGASGTNLANAIGLGATNLANGIGANATNFVQAYATALNLKQDFGAKGDGVTDDTAAFQAAFNKIASPSGVTNGWLYVPAGRYKITSTITIPPNTWPPSPVLSTNSGFKMTGAGMHRTILDGSSLGNVPMIQASATSIGNEGLLIREMAMKGPQNGGSSVGVGLGVGGQAFAGQLFNLMDCAIYGFGTGVACSNLWNITFDNCNISSNNLYGIHFYDTHNFLVKDCILTGCWITPTATAGGTAIAMDGPAPGVGDNGCLVNCMINGWTNAIVNNELNLGVENCHFEACDSYLLNSTNLAYAQISWFGSYVLEYANRPWIKSPALMQFPRGFAPKAMFLNCIFDNTATSRPFFNMVSDGSANAFPTFIHSQPVSYLVDGTGSTNTLYPINLPQTVASSFLAPIEVANYTNWTTFNSFTGWLGVRVVPKADKLLGRLGRYSISGLNSKAHQVLVLNADYTTNGSVTLPKSSVVRDWVWSRCAIVLKAGTTNYIVTDAGGITDDYVAGDSTPIYWDPDITNVYSAQVASTTPSGFGLNATNRMYGPVNYEWSGGSGTFNFTGTSGAATNIVWPIASATINQTTNGLTVQPSIAPNSIDTNLLTGAAYTALAVVATNAGTGAAQVATNQLAIALDQKRQDSTNQLAIAITNQFDLQASVNAKTNSLGAALRQERTDSTNQLAIAITNQFDLQASVNAKTNSLGLALRQERTDSTNQLAIAVSNIFDTIASVNSKTNRVGSSITDATNGLNTALVGRISDATNHTVVYAVNSSVTLVTNVANGYTAIGVSSSASSPTFDLVQSGVNQNQTLTAGNGTTLAPSGTGRIFANNVIGNQTNSTSGSAASATNVANLGRLKVSVSGTVTTIGTNGAIAVDDSGIGSMIINMPVTNTAWLVVPIGNGSSATNLYLAGTSTIENGNFTTLTATDFWPTNTHGLIGWTNLVSGAAPTVGWGLTYTNTGNGLAFYPISASTSGTNIYAPFEVTNTSAANLYGLITSSNIVISGTAAGSYMSLGTPTNKVWTIQGGNDLTWMVGGTNIASATNTLNGLQWHFYYAPDYNGVRLATLNDVAGSTNSLSHYGFTETNDTTHNWEILTNGSFFMTNAVTGAWQLYTNDSFTRSNLAGFYSYATNGTLVMTNRTVANQGMSLTSTNISFRTGYTGSNVIYAADGTTPVTVLTNGGGWFGGDVSENGFFRGDQVLNREYWSTNNFPLTPGAINVDFRAGFQFLTTNASFTVAGFINATNNLVNQVWVSVSNSSASSITMTWPGAPVRMFGTNTATSGPISAGKVWKGLFQQDPHGTNLIVPLMQNN